MPSVRRRQRAAFESRARGLTSSHLLLFDQNLSYEPKKLVEGEFPGSVHVSDVGLAGERDEDIWRFARAEGHALVSKDDDFRALALLHGAPPKVLWLRLGNAGTVSIASALTSAADEIRDFLEDGTGAVLELTDGR